MQNATLFGPDKQRVENPCTALGGKQVALYFAADWCPLCRRFTPALRAFYEAHAAELQIVFVSSDASPRAAARHFRDQGNWLMLAKSDPLIPELKRRYGVWSMREDGEFNVPGAPSRRRGGLPSVVVISPEGEEVRCVQPPSTACVNPPRRSYTCNHRIAASVPA